MATASSGASKEVAMEWYPNMHRNIEKLVYGYRSRVLRILDENTKKGKYCTPICKIACAKLAIILKFVT
jgi:hypothetical protein